MAHSSSDTVPLFLPRVFSLGLYPGVGMVVVNVVKKVWLTRKTPPGASSHDIRDPRHPTPRRWKRLRPSPPPP